MSSGELRLKVRAFCELYITGLSAVHRAQDTESCRHVSSDSYTMGLLPNTSREVPVSFPGVFKNLLGIPLRVPLPGEGVADSPIWTPGATVRERWPPPTTWPPSVLIFP